MKSDVDVVKGWIQKAESDLVTANLCITNKQGLDAACFHAQQASEKLLKAYLIAYDIEFPFVHFLERLIDLCSLRDPEFQTIKPLGIRLTPYAVELRYDNEFFPELEIAREAYEKALEIKSFVMERMPPELKQGGDA
jgi:HEPN domain-containing protein